MSTSREILDQVMKDLAQAPDRKTFEKIMGRAYKAVNEAIAKPLETPKKMKVTVKNNDIGKQAYGFEENVFDNVQEVNIDPLHIRIYFDENALCPVLTRYISGITLDTEE